MISIQPLIIGIDIDGTITCTDSFLALLNDSFQTSIRLSDLKDNKIQHLVNCTSQQFKAWLAQNELAIYGSLPLLPHVKETILKWHKHHTIYFVTARPAALQEVTYHLLDLHGLPYDSVTLLGKHDKTTAITQLKIDLFIEDNIHNANDISTKCNIPVLLLTMPYNEVKHATAQTARVNDWLEIERYVANFIK